MLTLKQAANRLQVSRRRVNAIINAGDLPAQRFGNAWAIREEDLLAYEERRRPAGNPNWAKVN